jgi:hypothetical protein
MKKFLFLILLLIPVMAFAQPDSTAYPQPGSIFDIFSDLNYWLSSTATVAGLTIFLTLLVAKFWKTITAIWKQVVALLIAVVLMIAGNLANIGFMAEFSWLTTVVYGLVTGFMANGLYDLKNAIPK